MWRGPHSCFSQVLLLLPLEIPLGLPYARAPNSQTAPTGKRMNDYYRICR